MHDQTAVFENREITQAHPGALPPQSESDFFKWVAGVLVTVILALAAWGLKPDAYRDDKPVLEQKLEALKKSNEEQRADLDNLDRKLNRLCIALGVDPEGPADAYPRKARHE
jgi:hypothetical protein